jgi:hypothetical protein
MKSFKLKDDLLPFTYYGKAMFNSEMNHLRGKIGQVTSTPEDGVFLTTLGDYAISTDMIECWGQVYEVKGECSGTFTVQILIEQKDGKELDPELFVTETSGQRFSEVHHTIEKAIDCRKLDIDEFSKLKFKLVED